MKIRLLIALMLATTLSATAADKSDYLIVVSKETHGNEAWKQVVEALVMKHGGETITHEGDITEILPKLREGFPKYTCFVATPEEATRAFVQQVHQITRKLDDDPYTDTFWGILTGYDAACALRIAKTEKPLTIKKVASGTEVALEKCHEGIWYCELKKGRMVRKEPGGKPETQSGPGDTTKALVDTLNDYKADLFVTSGHATEDDWQIGYTYKNGYFRCANGQIYGQDTSGKKHPVNSSNPKVYMPIGNCLMGHVDDRDAMALAFMNSAGVTQMLGYTVPTWFGYGGWGCLDYFVEQPGRYTFVEAFFANHHALIHNLENRAGNQRGMEFDRDVVALYGDPAWEARMAEGPKHYGQNLTVEDGVYTLTITRNEGEKSFEPVNVNGAQRGGRPIVAFLPHRVGPATLLHGADLEPTIADDFVLLPLPDDKDTDEFKIVFKAKPLDK